MIPYPGESLAIFDAADGSDFTLGGDVVYRDGSRTLAAGDDWRAWVAPGSSDYLETGTEDVVVSWAVEVLSGTVTVTAAEGYDPDFADDPTRAATRALGSHTVTGPATLVIPSGITVAEVFDELGTGDAFMLHLSATAGSAVAQQVKLRVWPPSGALGGWSDVKPSWETSPIAPTIQYHSPLFDGDATSTDPAASWDDAGAAFHAAVSAGSGPSSRGFGSLAPTASARQGMDKVTLTDYATSWRLIPVLIMLTGRDWRTVGPIGPGLVQGVDWVRPPNEVEGDFAFYAQQIGDGSTGWADATVTIAGSGTMPGSPTFAADAGEWTDDDPTASTAYTVPVSHGFPTVGTVALPTSGRMIFVSLSHTIVDGDADAYPGWGPSGVGEGVSRDGAIGYSLGPVQTFATMPPYRVWSPTAVPPRQPLRLMQRSDGLGMGSGRVFGVGTRQSSTRVFGSL